MNMLNDSFCILPFVQRFITYKLNYICCVSDIPLDDSLHNIKRKMYNGEKIPQCAGCYNNEQHNITSTRIKETTQWVTQYPEILNKIHNWYHNNTPLNTYYYDIRYSNKCNLGCISCRPTASSFKAKELRMFEEYDIISKNDTDLISTIDLSSTAKIYLAGGEPLIIDECLKIINDIASLPTEYQPELIINTNLSRINSRTMDNFAKIAKLTIVISVDAYGTINEYHRWPLSWDKFMYNLHRIKTLDAYLMFNTVIDAVSVINCSKIRLLEDNIDKWNLSIINDKHSAPLFIENIPPQHKTYVSCIFSEIKKSKFFSNDTEFRKSVDTVLNKISSSGDYGKLYNFIKKNDNLRNIKYYDYINLSLEPPYGISL